MAKMDGIVERMVHSLMNGCFRESYASSRIAAPLRASSKRIFDHFVVPDALKYLIEFVKCRLHALLSGAACDNYVSFPSTFWHGFVSGDETLNCLRYVGASVMNIHIELEEATSWVMR